MSDIDARIAAQLQPVLGIPVLSENDPMALDHPTCATVSVQETGHLLIRVWHEMGGDALFDMTRRFRDRLAYSRPIELGLGLTIEDMIAFEHRIVQGEADYADHNQLDVAFNLHNKPALTRKAEGQATQDRQSQR